MNVPIRLVNVLKSLALHVNLQLRESLINFACHAFLAWYKHQIDLLNIGEQRLKLRWEDRFLCTSHIPCDCEDTQVLLTSVDRGNSLFWLFIFHSWLLLNTSRNWTVKWIVVSDAEQGSELKQLVDVLKHEDHIVKSIASLILDLHLGWAVVCSRDVKLLDLLTSESINSIFSAIFYLVDLEIDDFVDKLTIRVTRGLCMQVNSVLSIVTKHEALEANTWVAGLRLTIDHLCSDPFNIGVVIFIFKSLNLRNWLLNFKTSVVLPHFLRQFVNHSGTQVFKPVVAAVL